jgi:hypothetical protein
MIDLRVSIAVGRFPETRLYCGNEMGNLLTLFRGMSGTRVPQWIVAAENRSGEGAQECGWSSASFSERRHTRDAASDLSSQSVDARSHATRGHVKVNPRDVHLRTIITSSRAITQSRVRSSRSRDSGLQDRRGRFD